MTTSGPRQPNFLFIMADQLAAPALPIYGHKIVKAPHIARLAESGVVFDNAYCNSPICAPSRFSMLSGQLATTIGAFDNASEFPASIPTVAHYLSAVGYQTILSGKMHFIGPDQLHGFGERLTTDINSGNGCSACGQVLRVGAVVERSFQVANRLGLCQVPAPCDQPQRSHPV